MNSQETLQKRALFSVGFHEDFVRAFDQTPEEADFEEMNLHFEKGKIDKKYLAKLLLNGNAKIWKNIANMNQGLASDAKHLTELYEDICSYINNIDFLDADSENDFEELFHYFTQKFPKSSFTTEKTRIQTHDILIKY